VTGDALTVEPLADVGEARAEWAALAEAAGNPFVTPEWCQAWLTHIGADLRLHVFGGRRPDGTLGAIVPLVVTRGRYVRKARFLGFGPSNELGPIVAPDERDAGAAVLRDALAATRSEWDVFVGEYLPGFVEPTLDPVEPGDGPHRPCLKALVAACALQDRLDSRKPLRNRRRAPEDGWPEKLERFAPPAVTGVPGVLEDVLDRRLRGLPVGTEVLG